MWSANRWVHYATFDTLCTWHLYHILRKKLEEMKWAPDPCYFSALPGGASVHTHLRQRQAEAAAAAAAAAAAH